MRAQSIGEHGALAHEQGPGAMGHEDGLLLDRLDRHEPHRRALNGFADRFGIERVALAALHLGLHVGRRDQANLVPHRGERARPVVRRAARLYAD